MSSVVETSLTLASGARLWSKRFLHSGEMTKRAFASQRLTPPPLHLLECAIHLAKFHRNDGSSLRRRDHWRRTSRQHGGDSSVPRRPTRGRFRTRTVSAVPHW